MKLSKSHVFWSDLLIEAGTRDPLAVWRVGDRLINELLPGFSTVVSQRPARYFSMYCWILREASVGCTSTLQEYWSNFYQLEGIFLSSVAGHEKHNYQQFSGQIGSEFAGKLLAKAKADGILDTSDLRRRHVSNGWEPNYKGSMASFHLTRINPASPGGIELTDRGDALADAFEHSIAQTSFLQNHRHSRDLPITVVEELAKAACPCLLHDPRTKVLELERDATRSILMTFPPNNGDMEVDERQWLSFRLLLEFLNFLRDSSLVFSHATWRRALSTGCVAENIAFFPSPESLAVYRQWQLYALDSLFVFAVESGLQGFLEYLQKQGGVVRTNLARDCIGQREIEDACKRIGNPLSDPDSILEVIASLNPSETLELETKVTDLVLDSSGISRVAMGFVLFAYCICRYRSFKEIDVFRNAMTWYESRAYVNDDDYSLRHAWLLAHGMSDLDLCQRVFFGHSVLGRQQQTRTERGKEVAWFSISPPSELDSYIWEAEYTPHLYRAPRIWNVLGFLLNMNLVSHDGESWRALETVEASEQAWT